MGPLLAELYARAPRGIDLGLERMAAACAKEGHPERSFEVVHVAGTNGKGSTCAMLAQALLCNGARVGLYTSPHLARFAERIRVDGVPIDDTLLEASLRTALSHRDLTFFECATLAAFLAFRARGVDACVLEVGLGGRLDATNVVASPKVTVVTRIALDHEDKLGSTLAAIAAEKAGIAKRGVPLVLGPLGPEAERAATDVATRAGAHVVRAADDALGREIASGMKLSMKGAHQRDNAQIAAVAGRLAGIPRGALERGIAEATWPGRFEILRARDTTFVLDAAHNPDGVAALERALADAEIRPDVLVFGALADKRWREMLDALASLADQRVYAEPQGRRAVSVRDLADGHPGVMASGLDAALDRATTLARGGTVLVCGSIYLVGAARAALLNEPTDPPVAL